MTIVDSPRPSIRQAPEPEPRRFTREEYHQMGDMGLFVGQRVQLIEGQILTMSPQLDPHATTVTLITEFFIRLLPHQYRTRPQLPLAFGKLSEPEPDLAIVERPFVVLTGDHPSTALLVIEVADSTIKLDRKKSTLYAKARIPEYWIINLKSHRLEVFRSPRAGRYTRRRTLDLSQSLSPFAFPELILPVKSLFPHV